MAIRHSAMPSRQFWWMQHVLFMSLILLLCLTMVKTDDEGHTVDALLPIKTTSNNDNPNDSRSSTDSNDDKIHYPSASTISSSTSSPFSSKARTTTIIPLGHKMLQSEFLLNYTNMNHGSFGACPKRVLEYQSKLRMQQEQQPDPWMRRRYKELVNVTRNKLSTYLHLNADEYNNNNNNNNDQLVLVESASTAVNSILRSWTWQPGDIILYFDIEYMMIQNTAAWLEQTQGIEIIKVPIQFPKPEQQEGNDNDTNDRGQHTIKKNHVEDINVLHDIFVQPLQNALEQLQTQSKLNRLQVAVFDHMASAPAIIEPIVELATMVKKYTNSNCFVLIDGAHALGQIPNPLGWLNRSTTTTTNQEENNSNNNGEQKVTPPLQVIDAYLSNGHKWLFSPKGSAILWINPAVVTAFFPEPTVISSANAITASPDGSTKVTTGLLERYSYVSTRDYTSWIAMAAALEFRELTCGGEDVIYNYTRNLALTAKHHLQQRWKVPVPLFPDSMEVFMINIPLPVGISNTTIATKLMDYLLEEHELYIRIIPMWWLVDDDDDVVVDDGTTTQGPSRFFTRLSAQIYLELSDFVRLGELVMDFMDSNNLVVETKTGTIE